ncbi:hypothetical protein H4219_005702 [Mycoemilia scoparia]|uniref:Uncharacterized protein n=1 Tax=Mycoemilia scoparia TaxID=417184 RepID=A0A9W7ZSK8_9FUNG|nr:hypothetical protein H4219_005702 [Mycoemilia scoparia]
MESRGRGGHGRGRGRGGNGQRHNSRGFRNLTPYQRQLVKKKTEKNQRSNVRRKYFKQIEKHDDGENGDHQAIEMDDEQQSEFLHKLLMGDEDKQVSKGENTKKSLNGNESDRGENDNDDDEDIDSDVSSSNSSSLNQKSSTSKIVSHVILSHIHLSKYIYAKKKRVPLA